MNRIQRDPFWDGKTGGGVRCSSDGDANTYQDPAQHTFEGNGGRSLASLLPGGLRGVVIPRATTFGGSRGFDPHKPRLVNIDPDIKGQSCVIDLSQITKENMEQAFMEAAQNEYAQQDIRLLAAQTFHNLAIGYEPVGMGPSRGPRLVERRAPLGEFGAYVVPRSSLGGGQIQEQELREMPPTQDQVMSPSVSPRTGGMTPTLLKQAGIQPRPFRMAEAPENMTSNVGLPAPPSRQTDEYGNPLAGATIVDPEPPMKPRGPAFRDQTPPTVQTQPTQARIKPPPRTVRIEGPTQVVPVSQGPSVALPEAKVSFEMEGWGTMEAAYHEVIKNDCVLVLVWDNNFKGGMKYFPPSTDKAIRVRITGTDKVFDVNSYGTRFQHGNYEYCLLVIDPDSEVQ